MPGQISACTASTVPWPLPGAAGLDCVSLPVEVSPQLRAHLLGLYGSLASEVLEPAVTEPSLLEPLTPEAPDIGAQVVYAAEREWARNPEDVVRRRTTLALRGLADAKLTRRVEQLNGPGEEARQSLEPPRLVG